MVCADGARHQHEHTYTITHTHTHRHRVCILLKKLSAGSKVVL